MRSRLVAVSGAALVSLLATPAFAHHVMGGRLPATFLEGLLSGLGHPVIGLDHLAFIVAAGIAVGVAGASVFLPGLLVTASVAGVFVHAGAVDLPAADLLVAASVVAAGVSIARGKAIPGLAWGALFAVGGLIHGYAFGESIVGADRTALGGYLVGLAAVQVALAIGIAFAIRAIAGSARAALPRAAGAAIAAVGVIFAAVQAFA